MVYTVNGNTVAPGDILDAGDNEIAARYVSTSDRYGSSAPVTNTLTVTRKTARIAIGDFVKTFGDGDPAWNAAALLERPLSDVLINNDHAGITLNFLSPVRDGGSGVTPVQADRNLEPVESSPYPVTVQINDPDNRIANYELEVTEGSIRVDKRNLTVRPANRSYGWKANVVMAINGFETRRRSKNDMPGAWIVFDGLAPGHNSVGRNDEAGSIRLTGTNKGKDDAYLDPSWTELDRLFDIRLSSAIDNDDPVGTVSDVGILSISPKVPEAGSYTIDSTGTGTVTITKEIAGLTWSPSDFDPAFGRVILYGQKLRDVIVGEDDNVDKRGNVRDDNTTLAGVKQQGEKNHACAKVLCFRENRGTLAIFSD